MSLSIGIVGLPNVGKSTLFNALTKAQNAQAANYPFCTIEPNKATVAVPDERVDALSAKVSPKKTIHASVDFIDIAGLVGVFLGGALYHVPILIDGLISSVAALAAVRLCPDVKGYMVASHASNEPAGCLVLDALGLEAPIHAKMALGEGTGAVALIPLLDMALSLYHSMCSFAEYQMDAYVPLS